MSTIERLTIIALRRREALLSSISTPHPETANWADGRLGDWVADLPDEERLVDLDGGIAVRWVEGQGWLQESTFDPAT